MSRTTDRAVYNSRIAGMLTPFSLRRLRCVLVPIMLLAATARGQDWAGAEQELAAKIVAVTGQRTISVEVSNRSSSGNPGLGAASADDIRRGLLSRLAALGARFVSPEQAAASVRVSLSEDLQSYVWVADIRMGANPTPGQAANDTPLAAAVMVSLPRPATLVLEPETMAVVLHKTLLWPQQERILDVAVIEGNPGRMLVLDSGGVMLYRPQDGRWQAEQSLAITHSRPWPRDLRGRIELRKDHLFDAYLPGVFCRSTATWPFGMNCYESDDAWPIGTNLSNLNASFSSSRNYFSGSLQLGVGKHLTTSPFYSAAAFLRGESTLWLFAAVDGQVHLLDGVTDQAIGELGWGSDLVSVRSGCGSGLQVLASGKGEGSSDTVRAFEVHGREPVAASPALEIAGSITALWTESGETSAVAVVRHSVTGGYEAFRLTLACGR